MTARYVTLVGLLLLVIGSGWLLRSEPEDETGSTQRALSDGYYLLDATISDTNETGQLIYSLKAQRIDHVPDDGSVRFTNLKVLYAVNAEDSWTIEAERGAMDADRESLNLRGDVTITSLEADAERNTTIITEQLSLDIASNQARTEQEVRIQISGGELRAKGMQADLGTKKINLLSDVRGRFGDTP